MITARLNLLPWRETEFRRKSRDMLIKILIFVGISLLCVLLLLFLQDQLSAELAQQRQALQQQKQQLNETQQKVTALRQQVQGAESLIAIEPSKVTHFFQLLPSLPLEKGELNWVEFNATQIRLQGWVASQGEFEQLDQFLTQTPWLSQVKLAQLTPQANGELQFNYQLNIGKTQ